MKSISRQDQGKIKELARTLDGCAKGVSKEIDAYNEELKKLQAPVAAVVQAYNTAATALHDFLDGLATAAEEYRDSRSERWQSGDTGAAHETWWNTLVEVAGTVTEIEEDDLTGEELHKPELFDAGTWTYPPDAP
jgi:hypothetical protein